MISKPRVSCVIIFLNAEKYLEESIRSVIDQSAPDWELLLVNDGSTDGSGRIAHDHAARMPGRIRYLEHDQGLNRGKNASRNLGIQHSTGEFIAFLDADDVWLPNKLGEQVALLERHPEAAMVYGRTEIWSSWADTPGQCSEDSFYDLGVEPDTLIQPPRLFIQLLEGWAQTPTTCSAMVRSSVLGEVGGFDVDYHEIFEDQAFFAKIELEYPVFVSGSVWARYRQHRESSYRQHAEASVSDRSQHYTVLLRFLDWLQDYLDEREIDEPEIRQFLARRRRSCQQKLQLLKRPLMGRLTLSWLHFIEWFLGVATRIGRSILPASLRNWLWVNIGKKIFMSL